MRTLTVSLIIVILTATVGLGWMFDNLYEQYLLEQPEQNEDITQVIEDLGSNLAASINELENRESFISNWNKKNAYLIDIIKLNDLALPQELIKSIKSGKPLPLETSQHIAFHYYLAKTDELLVLKSDLVDPQSSKEHLNMMLTLLFYVVLLILFLAWLYPLISGLIRLGKTAKKFGEGEFSQRINVGRLSYIRDIELEFNHMAQRIENLVSDVKLLSSAVSHDLRTPLARIRFGIDTLAEEEDPVTRERYHQKISDNIDEMSSLVETLLTYARLDSAMLEIKKDSIDLALAVENCIKNKVSDTVKIEFEKADNNFMVVGDANYLNMLIANLLQNALQYCERKILVKLSQHNDIIKLVVSDDGIGISPEQREQILKPFVRGLQNQDNKPVTKGHGIGLAIVKRVLDWHQGEITISNSIELSGAEFTVNLKTTSNN